MNHVHALVQLNAASQAIFADTLAALCDTHGFRVLRISPADSPSLAELSTADRRFALRLVVATGLTDHSTLLMDHVTSVVVLPNGTRLAPQSDNSPRSMPALQSPTHIARVVASDGLGQVGRAGMLYRDLIPDRLGGHVIASHISIPRAGPVPDYVHCHNVLAQIIYVVSGSVTVVYEGQGEPFVAHAGSCILQPPMIRHRVLANSDNLSVLEVTSPAEHDTFGDLDLQLPNGPRGAPTREWSGQTFVFHDASRPDAVWSANWCNNAELEARSTGIGAATRGVIDVVTVRAKASCAARVDTQQQSFALLFVLAGELTVDGDAAPLRATESISLSRGEHVLQCDQSCQFVAVTMA
jgi:quercetin dioxygenase-like cupin family protein